MLLHGVLSHSVANVQTSQGQTMHTEQRSRTGRLLRLAQAGGDGLFQEVLDGVVALRTGADAARAAAAAQLRLGHVPGGSTDAVAYSINGTRSAATAALHIALGDR